MTSIFHDRISHCATVSYDIILGRIRVAWHPNGEEEVVREKNVGLADRSLMPGDVVRRLIAGKDTQRGRILKMYFFREKIIILEITFSNFSCMFLNPNYFFQL